MRQIIKQGNSYPINMNLWRQTIGGRLSVPIEATHVLIDGEQYYCHAAKTVLVNGRLINNGVFTGFHVNVPIRLLGQDYE